jgi:hypothetical protein
MKKLKQYNKHKQTFRVLKFIGSMNYLVQYILYNPCSVLET